MPAPKGNKKEPKFDESKFIEELENSGLTAKQTRFCQEYIVDYNGTQAAIRAGYSEDSAALIASENIRKPYIKQHIDKLLKEQQLRTEITADKVLSELYKLGTADIREIFTDSGQLKDIKTLPDNIAAAVNSVEVVTRSLGKDGDGNTEVEHTHKIRLADKKAALELLGKSMTMFSDKIQHDHVGDINITLSVDDSNLL